jgi:hypothetical protein
MIAQKSKRKKLFRATRHTIRLIPAYGLAIPNPSQNVAEEVKVAVVFLLTTQAETLAAFRLH